MYCIYLKNLRQIFYYLFENDLMLIIYVFIHHLFVCLLLMYLSCIYLFGIFDNLFIHLFIVVF